MAVGDEERNEERLLKTGIFGVVLLANLVALFCIINPWFDGWQRQGYVLVVIEAVFTVVVGVPVFFYHYMRKKKPLRQSITATLQTIIDFLAGWV